MKLKYVLFSGLLLSVGFTACTNEDFTEAISPVSTDGIALGEITINVGKGADTKAIMEDMGGDYVPVWKAGDKLGAARFHTLATADYDGDKEEVVGITNGTTSFEGNNTFALTSGEETSNGVFTTVDPQGLTAGAHVLYYPQYTDITPTSKGLLPVELKSYDIDCADPLKNVSDNMFAYDVIKLLPEQTQTDEFTLAQVPVLYNLYFTPDFVNTNVLNGPVTIKHIVIEAWKGMTPVMTEAGYIQTVPGAVPTKDDYNDNTLGESIEYVADPDGEVDHLFYTVKNSDNADYQLIENTVTTKKAFKFSALPWSGKADKVIIKVVTDAGVFATEYDATSVNEKGTKLLDAFNAKATVEGGVLSLNVHLNTVELDNVIYTAEQMEDALKNVKNGESYHWILGEPIELPNAELILDENTDADITISRYPLTLKTIDMKNGSLTINNDLTVKGNVTLGANVAAFETGSNVVTSDDALLGVEGKLTIGAGKVQEVAVTLSEAGEIQIDRSGIATLTGVADTKVGNIKNQGTLTLKSIKIQEGKTLTITEETVAAKLTLGDANIVNNGTVNNKGVFALNGQEFTNNGIFNQDGEFNATASGSKFVNAAGAELNINADVTSAWAGASGTVGLTIENQPENVADKLPAAEITIAKDAKLVANQAAYPVINDGIINVNGQLEETGVGAIDQSANRDARIYVNKGANAGFAAATSKITNGYIVKDAEVARFVRNGVNNARVAMNATSENIAAVKADTDALTIFMNGSFEADKAFFSNKYFILNDGTIKFTENAEVSGAGIYVAGNVTFTTDEPTGITLTLDKLGSQDLTIYAGGKLTLDEGVKLTADAVDEVIQENGAEFVYDSTKNIGTNVKIVRK